MDIITLIIVKEEELKLKLSLRFIQRFINMTILTTTI